MEAFNDPDRIYSWPKSRNYEVVKGIPVEATVGRGAEVGQGVPLEVVAMDDVTAESFYTQTTFLFLKSSQNELVFLSAHLK